MKWVFEESLDGAAAVLREQLEMAKAKGNTVEVRISAAVFTVAPNRPNSFRSNQHLSLTV